MSGVSGGGGKPPTSAVRITPADSDETLFNRLLSRLKGLEAQPNPANKSEITQIVGQLRDVFGVDVERGTLIVPLGNVHHDVEVLQGRWVHAKELPTYAERAELIYPQAVAFRRGLELADDKEPRTEGTADLVWQDGQLVDGRITIDKKQKIKLLGFIPWGSEIRPTTINLVSKGRITDTQLRNRLSRIQSAALKALGMPGFHSVIDQFHYNMTDKLLEWGKASEARLDPLSDDVSPLLKAFKKSQKQIADDATNKAIQDAVFKFKDFWKDLLKEVPYASWEQTSKTSYGLEQPDSDASWTALEELLNRELDRVAPAPSSVTAVPPPSPLSAALPHSSSPTASSGGSATASASGAAFTPPSTSPVRAVPPSLEEARRRSAGVPDTSASSAFSAPPQRSAEPATASPVVPPRPPSPPVDSALGTIPRALDERLTRTSSSGAIPSDEEAGETPTAAPLPKPPAPNPPPAAASGREGSPPRAARVTPPPAAAAPRVSLTPPTIPSSGQAPIEPLPPRATHARAAQLTQMLREIREERERAAAASQPAPPKPEAGADDHLGPRAVSTEDDDFKTPTDV